MKKLFLTTSILCAALLARENGVYVELAGGVDTADRIETHGITYKYEKSYFYEAMIGYEYDLFRIEYQYRGFNASVYRFLDYAASGDVSIDSHMVDLYYSGYNDTQFVTSLGIGIGTADVSMTNVKELAYPVADKTQGNVFAYQGMLNIGYMIDEHMTLSMRYSYFATLKGDDFEATSQHLLGIGFRYLF